MISTRRSPPGSLSFREFPWPRSRSRACASFPRIFAILSDPMTPTPALALEPKADEGASTSRPAKPRLVLDPESLQRSFLNHIRFSRGKSKENATPYDRFLALALTARDQLSERWVAT